MHSESSKLICILRIAGFEEREGCSTFVNFIIPREYRLEVCVHKKSGTFYVIKHYSNTETAVINKNTLTMIMEL